MMQLLPRWRNTLILKPMITQSILSTSTTHLAWFHSTSAVLVKWKQKFNSDGRGDEQPSKDYIRYTVKQKRTDTKKALKNILFNEGGSASRAESFLHNTDQLSKKSRIKQARQPKRARQKKSKYKDWRENLFEDYDENPDRIFRATFGNRSRTFRHSETGFDWRDISGRSNCRMEPDDGTYGDRNILGLPTAGPLKIEEVKAAFRVSALKWHPDKHQGSSQADAEEKFKDCVNAYKSLCCALSAE